MKAYNELKNDIRNAKSKENVYKVNNTNEPSLPSMFVLFSSFRCLKRTDLN